MKWRSLLKTAVEVRHPRLGSLEAFLRDYEELCRPIAGVSEERKMEFLADVFCLLRLKAAPKQGSA
jgi:hypothetical protein